MDKYDIVVLGSINMDIMVTVSRFPQYGETVFARTIHMTPGGKGANQATAVARQGRKQLFLGAVGDDSSGRQLLQELKANGVDTAHILVDADHGTGTFVPIVDDDGENTMVGTLGANSTIGSDYIEKVLGAVEAEVLLLQMETSRESILTAMRKAKEKGMYVVLDPAPADGYFPEALELADLVTPNQQETERITGVTVINEETALEAAQKLEKLGVPNSVIKMGVHGNLVYQAGKVDIVPAHKVKVVNTVGAGDTFVAALVSNYVETKDLVSAVEFGNTAAAIKISRGTGQASIPTADEVASFVG